MRHPCSPFFAETGSLQLDRGSPVPLHRQLTDQLEAAVVAGRLRPGEFLPEYGRLAQMVGVSLTTVRRSFDDLVVRGRIARRTGVGTWVQDLRPPDRRGRPRQVGVPSRDRSAGRPAQVETEQAATDEPFGHEQRSAV